MPNAPLKHVSGSTVTTVVDPRFGTGATPTQPSGWGSGSGSGSGGPAPLTGDTYTAPGLLVPAGALDVWRAARATTDTALVEIAVFGDSTTYGMADPNRGASYYSWTTALKAAALADGHPDGGHGYHHRADDGRSLGSPEQPTVTATGVWTSGTFRSRTPYHHDGGSTTDTITITGKGTAVRLTFVGHTTTGKAAYSIDGGPETVIDTYRTGSRVSYEAIPVYIGGLSEGQHAVTIRTAGASASSSTADDVEFHIEFVRSAGIVVHKNATSGGILSDHFRADTNEAASEAMAPFWMGMKSLNAAGSLQNARYEGLLPGDKPAYRNVKLAVAQFGTNDLGAVTSTGHDAVANYLENAAYFAATCRAVGCSGLIIAPPWTQLPAAGATGTRRAKGALPSIALAYGVAYADFQEPLGYDLRNWSTRNNASAGTGGSHISADAYAIEGTWLWEHLLAL